MPERDMATLIRLHERLDAGPTLGSAQTTRLHRSQNGDQPYSRKDWLSRSEWLNLLWSYVSGDMPLLGVDIAYQQATVDFLRMARHDYGNLIVTSLQDRTQVIGGRTEQESDADGDEFVRKALEANGAFLSDTLRFTYTMGEAGVLIGPPAEGDLYGIATPIDPRMAVWTRDPLNPNRVTSFLRVVDFDGEPYYYLFLPADDQGPDRCRRAVRNNGQFEWRESDGYESALPVQGIGVPFVPFRNEHGQGEFERNLDLLDRITNNISDRLWSSKFQVFFLRAFIGEFPDVDPQGNPIDWDAILFELDPGAILRLPTGTTIHEGKQLDLSGFSQVDKDNLRELSATTRTPFPALNSDSVNQSAAGATGGERGLVFKAADRVRRFTPGTNRVLSLLYAHSRRDATGPLNEPVPVTSIWAPVEQYTLAEKAQLAGQVGDRVPMETLWELFLQLTPEQIARAKVQQRAERVAQTRQLRADQQAQASLQPTQPAEGVTTGDGGATV